MPVSSIAIAVEGVLQKATSSAPIPVGIALYHSLKENFNILLYSEQDRKSLDHWLAIEALNLHSAVEYNENTRIWMGEEERKLAQVNSLRQRGYSIDVVLEPNPMATYGLLTGGYSVMTFTHALYAMPQWRPDYSEKRKPWEELEREAQRVAELRYLDTRLKSAEDKDVR